MKCDPEQFFHFHRVHPSWLTCLKSALREVDQGYFDNLQEAEWLPGPAKIFNAFSIPIDEVNYVLFGESPYPRRESAMGYAFWDGAVNELWSSSGLSTKVNRATSLRNIIKMLLVAEGLLHKSDVSQTAISQIDKNGLVQTNAELFTNFLCHGFLLLNASLVLQSTPLRKDAKAWMPFVKALLNCLLNQRPNVKFILLGNIASAIDQWINAIKNERLYAEHPYNLSFITNEKVIAFFKPLHLLLKKET